MTGMQRATDDYSFRQGFQIHVPVNRLVGMGNRRKRPERQIAKEDVLRSISRSEGRSANLHQLLMEFEATPTARREIKDILTQLVKEGKLRQHKGSRYESPAREALEGTI